jgi:ABC-type lipoprotein export system ATPase subunit
VLVTHDPAVAALADRLIHLRDGRVERQEEPALISADTADISAEALR